MSLTMAEDERNAFLAESHIAVLAVEQPGRGPLTVPVWYAYESGGALVVLTSSDSDKVNRTGPDGDSRYWISTRGWSVRFVA